MMKSGDTPGALHASRNRVATVCSNRAPAFHDVSSPIRRPNRRSVSVGLTWVLASLALVVGQLSADEPKPSAATPASKTAGPDVMAKRIQSLTEQLANSVFVGRFSIDGKSEMQEDRYEIEGAAKLPGGDLWLIKTRIRYGDHDVSVPLPINIRWANDTPVMTVDQLTVPGLGTFDARVVISGSRYAGTWQHGDVGGHMIGRIEKADKPAEKAGDKSGTK